MRELEKDYYSDSSVSIVSNTFVSNVFLWMFGALAVTALTAYLFASSESLLSLMVTVKGDGTVGVSVLGWVVMLAPILLVFVMSLGIEKMSATTMVVLFVVYSILMGMSLCFFFLAYTSTSIVKTFVITAAMFGIMAVLGYTTKMDLTKIGSLLIMALIGVIIATLVNVFLHSQTLDYIISIAGVVIFTGLTAYDVQKIKRIGEYGLENDETMVKITVHAALSLYLDFINLFLYLLRFLGNRK